MRARLGLSSAKARSRTSAETLRKRREASRTRTLSCALHCCHLCCCSERVVGFAVEILYTRVALIGTTSDVERLIRQCSLALFWNSKKTKGSGDCCKRERVAMETRKHQWHR